ncbi:hypothetical protein [Dipodfec virus UOA04_Rod_962]|nr:hypothetical protein [Dipodfec virus UOA04_Rod_962]
MTVQDVIKNRAKLAGTEKAVAELQAQFEEYAKTDTDKSHITPLGTEILSQESAVSTKTKPLSLREKIAELDALARRVLDQKALNALRNDLAGDFDPDEEFDDSDIEDPEEDLSFGANDFHFVPKTPDDGVDDGEEPAPVTQQAGEQPSQEPSEGDDE